MQCELHTVGCGGVMERRAVVRARRGSRGHESGAGIIMRSAPGSVVAVIGVRPAGSPSICTAIGGSASIVIERVWKCRNDEFDAKLFVAARHTMLAKCGNPRGERMTTSNR